MAWTRIRKGLYGRTDGANVMVNLDGPGWRAFDAAGAEIGSDHREATESGGDCKPFATAAAAKQFLDVFAAD